MRERVCQVEPLLLLNDLRLDRPPDHHAQNQRDSQEEHEDNRRSERQIPFAVVKQIDLFSVLKHYVLAAVRVFRAVKAKVILRVKNIVKPAGMDHIDVSLAFLLGKLTDNVPVVFFV